MASVVDITLREACQNKNSRFIFDSAYFCQEMTTFLFSSLASKISLLLVNYLCILWLSLLVTFNQGLLKILPATFHSDQVKALEGVWKSGFCIYCNFTEINFRQNWCGLHQMTLLLYVTVWIYGFWICKVPCGNYRQKGVDIDDRAILWCTWVI